MKMSPNERRCIRKFDYFIFPLLSLVIFSMFRSVLAEDVVGLENAAESAKAKQVESVKVPASPVELAKFEGANLALNKPVEQSSEYSQGGTAKNAVDGNTDGHFSHGSVTSTSTSPKNLNAWFDIDLGGNKQINTIVIWNRTDCCAERLKNYWVFVSQKPFLRDDTPENLKKSKVVKVKVKGIMPNPYWVLDAKKIKGRYIRVQLDDSAIDEGILSMAEIQVFGK